MHTKMSEKRKDDSVPSTSCKKHRAHKLCTFETKMAIIKRAEGGECLASIGRSYGLSRSTVCTIVKSKEKLWNMYIALYQKLYRNGKTGK